jgi:cytoskeletal protein CcmA (bactofilin family)
MADNSRRVRDNLAKRPTIIADATIFQGDFKSSAPVIVFGMIEGDCEIDNLLTIERPGAWVGNIKAEGVIVNGKVRGNITTDGKLEIGSSGHILGDVVAGTLAIASGAVIEGEMHMTDHDEPHHFEEKRTNALLENIEQLKKAV